MIYDRHEDLAATTKRHPAIVRHRTGVTRDGRLLAQDIEVVMDGGAYCTLTPVVLSRGAIHAGGPYRCPNVRIRARATRTNTPPNGAFRGFGAPQTEFAAETHLNRIADALGHLARSRSAGGTSTGSATRRRPGQVLRASVAGEEVLERAAEAGEFERLRARSGAARSSRAGSGTIPGSPLRTERDRVATGVGLALAWHGAGFTGSGEVKLASVASLELTAEGRIDILVASTEMGQGTKTIFPQLVADALDVPIEAVDIAPQDTAYVPDSGPTVASRTAMVVGGLLIQAAGRLRERGRGGDRRVVRRDLPRLRPRRTARSASTSASSRIRASASTTRPTAATPTRRSAGRPASRPSTSTSTPARSRSATSSPSTTSARSSTRSWPRARSRAARSRRSATRRSRRSSCATAATSTTGSRPTSSRPRSTRRGSRRSSSRRRSTRVPHGAKGVGELPMDVGAPAVIAAIADATGAWIADLPASPERILAALAGVPAAAPLPPGASEPAAARTTR